MFPNGQEIGSRNIAFTAEYLRNLDINITGEDVGLSFSRRIRFYNDSGKVLVKRLRSLHNKQISNQERDYENSLSSIEHQSANYSDQIASRGSHGS
jgi:chemotaxis protein CheD